MAAWDDGPLSLTVANIWTAGGSIPGVIFFAVSFFATAPQLSCGQTSRGSEVTLSLVQECLFAALFSLSQSLKPLSGDIYPRDRLYFIGSDQCGSLGGWSSCQNNR